MPAQLARGRKVTRTSNVTLDGTPKVVNANVNPYIVTDSRGGSAGWT